MVPEKMLEDGEPQDEPANREEAHQEGRMWAQRLVELSERKMKLIKHLLSPEEYDSIVLSLTSPDSYDVSDGELQTSWGATSTKVVEDDNLDYSSSIPDIEPIERSLTDCLAKKREANEFFFACDDDESGLKKLTDLSLELKSGYYINYQSNDSEPAIIDDKSYFTKPNMGSLRSEVDREETTGDSLKCRQATCPFATQRNLEIMKKRLQGDKALDKLLLFQSHEKDANRHITSVHGFKQLLNIYGLFQVRKPTQLEWKDGSGFVKNMNRLKAGNRLKEASGCLEVKVISIMMREHPCLRDEERIAGKLADCGRELKLLGEIHVKLAKRLIRKVQSVQTRHLSTQLDIQSKLLIVVNQLIQINEKMKSMQEKLLVINLELLNIRQEQKFGSTTIFIEQDEDGLKSFANLCSTLKELVESLDADEGLKETLIGCVTMMKETNQKYVIKFASKKEKLMDEEEQKRIIELTKWIESVQMSIEFDKQSSLGYDCRLAADNDNVFMLNVIPSQFQFEISPHFRSKMKVTLSTNRRWIIPFINRTLIVSEVDVTIKQNCNMRYSLNLESLDGSIIIQLVVESKQLVRVDENRQEKLVNLLHANLFPAHSSLTENHMKVYQLMNYVDLGFLRRILCTDITNSFEYFHLDPQEDLLQETESVRYSLIKWRWINNLNHIVYLSNHENLKTHGEEAREFKAKLKGISLKRLDAGYDGIEVARARAIAYIRRLEIQLSDTVRAQSEEQKLRQDVEVPNVDRFLLHPRLSVDLSGFVRLATSLIPHPTVRRPLGAQKAADRWARLKTGFLDSSAGQQIGQVGGRSQLVVSLQSASNVPLRIINQPKPIQSRSLSPIISGPGLSPTPVSMRSGEFPLVSGSNLELATSYVELVFQRCQAASSLARGRHPAWNETLFLPIQVPKDAPMTAESSLVDEYLQISLWDYCCQQEETGGEDSSLQALDSSTLSPPRMTLKVSASNQRVERHLLGCLKIPLRALISSGKIEGTFALEQDGLLENYSFATELPVIIPAGLEVGESSIGASPTADRPQNTYIRLFITLDPPMAIDVSHPLEINFGPQDSEHLLRYAQYWQNTFSQPPIVATSGSRQSGASKASISRLHVRALVLLSNGNYVLISRLLRPLDPPPNLLDNITDIQCQMFALARFVSLLCPVKFGIFQHSARALASNLWFDSRQLLVKCLGGPEEKATLLCNYFLGMGKYSGLLLGDSIQEGRCVYVIVWEDFSSKSSLESELQLQAAELFKSISGISTTSSTTIKDTSINSAGSVQIWNPTTATNYSNIGLSPLLSVGAIVTMDNVYANLQNLSPTVVADTNFNIRSKQHWFPLADLDAIASSSKSTLSLNIGLSKWLGSVGKPVSWTKRCQKLELMRRILGPVLLSPAVRWTQINYQPRMSLEQCQQLTETIELEVKAHLLKWRPQRPTYFNRSLSRSIQSWLAQFEEHYSQGKQSSTSWHLELARLIKSEPLSGFRVPLGSPSSGRKLISCPLNVPYTGMKVILDTVYASGVANVDLVLRVGASSPQTQFLVACHVKSYPARVVSVWLYTAAILSV